LSYHNGVNKGTFVRSVTIFPYAFKGVNRIFEIALSVNPDLGIIRTAYAKEYSTPILSEKSASLGLPFLLMAKNFCLGRVITVGVSLGKYNSFSCFFH
jgi:hypothetical protein